MKRSRVTGEQIIAILREQDRRMATAEVRRRHGIGSVTFFEWKLRFGGMDIITRAKTKDLR